MYLWIRSQDKEKLLKVNDIAIEMNMIYGYFDKNTEYELLGTYNSKERALEVLDEIQNILKAKFMVRMDGNLKNIEKFLDISNFSYIQSHENADIKIINTYVYEMPKE